MKIAVASGKGGTGKTLIAASLARLLADELEVRLVDADVEEPDALLFAGKHRINGKPGKPVPIEQEEVFVSVPEINMDICTSCGLCGERCNFNALSRIGDVMVFYPHLCHSCTACFIVCPLGALSVAKRKIGTISRFELDGLPVTQGKLDIGEAKAAPLIEDTVNSENEEDVIIVDSPPGVSCSMLAAVKNADFCLLVAEDTPFGLHDLEAAVEVMYSLSMKFAVILNKWQEDYSAIENFISHEKIPLLLRIPFSEKMARLYSRQQLLDSFDPKLAAKLKYAGMAIISDLRGDE